jgi:ABC-type glycerol-3-phosphate transport system substrate-binding protein
LAVAACAAPGAAQPGAEARKDATVLVDNDWQGGDRLQVVQAWAARVSQVHPHIKVDLRQMPGQDASLANFAAGSQGDLHHVANTLAMLYGSKGLLRDISPTVAALRFDPTALYDVKDATHWENKRHGFMIQINSNVWVYNKTLFRQRGIVEPTDKWTWEDHLDAARKLTNVEQDQWGMTALGDVYPWYWQAGVEFLTADGKRTLYDSAGPREVLNWVVDLVTRHRASPSPAENTAKQPSFAKGSLATAIQSSPGRPLTTAIDGRFEWEIMPTPKHPRSGKAPALVVTGVANAVTKAAETRGHLRETVQALLVQYDKEIQELYLRLSTGSVPPLKSVFNSPASLQPPPQNLKLIGDQIATGRNYPLIVGFYDMHTAIAQEIRKAKNGEK